MKMGSIQEIELIVCPELFIVSQHHVLQRIETNCQGSVAKTFNLNYTSQLNVEDLPQGQYVLRINTANEVISKLVIIVPSSGK